MSLLLLGLRWWFSLASLLTVWLYAVTCYPCCAVSCCAVQVKPLDPEELEARRNRPRRGRGGYRCGQLVLTLCMSKHCCYHGACSHRVCWRGSQAQHYQLALLLIKAWQAVVENPCTSHVLRLCLAVADVWF